MKTDALRRYAMLFLILFIGRGWCKPFVNSLAAGVNEGEQGESRRRGDGMHSTKPIHTCSDVRMRPAFITLAGCIIGRPLRGNERCWRAWRRPLTASRGAKLAIYGTGLTRR